MFIQRISIKGLTTSSLLAVGVFSILLSVFTGNLFRNEALESQKGTISRIIDVAGQEVIRSLHDLSVDLGASTEKPDEFRAAFKAIDEAENRKTIVEALDDQFSQRFVTAGQLDLKRLRLFDLDFKLVAESRKGLDNLPPTLPAVILDQAQIRKGADRLKAVGGLWHSEKVGLHSTLVPVGGLFIKGYLEVVTDPAFNLRKVAEMIKSPITVYQADGKQVFQSEKWQELQSSSTLPVQFTFTNDKGEAIVKLEIIENIQNFLDHFSQLQWLNAAFFVGLVGVILLGSLWIMQSFVFRPLNHFMRDIESCAQGDLSIDIEPEGLRDINTLGQSLAELVDALRDQVTEINNHSHSLSNNASELSIITQETSLGVQQQQSQTEEVATAINEMSATVQEVARNAQSAAEAARQADEKSQLGRGIVSTTISAINTLARDIEKAGAVIQDLQNESQSIGTVIDVIRGIAEQTNLLALNAAIEAARAGEQGRGFAVVADEVRTLASRTQQSTQDIQDMVQRLQQDAEKAVTVMENSRNQADTTVSQAARADEALNDITKSVANISDMNTQIASASEEQSAVAEEINRNITKIRDIADRTADGADQTAKASESMAGLAGQMQAVVGKFKL